MCVCVVRNPVYSTKAKLGTSYVWEGKGKNCQMAKWWSSSLRVLKNLIHLLINRLMPFLTGYWTYILRRQEEYTNCLKLPVESGHSPVCCGLVEKEFGWKGRGCSRCKGVSVFCEREVSEHEFKDSPFWRRRVLCYSYFWPQVSKT